MTHPSQKVAKLTADLKQAEATVHELRQKIEQLSVVRVPEMPSMCMGSEKATLYRANPDHTFVTVP